MVRRRSARTKARAKRRKRLRPQTPPSGLKLSQLAALVQVAPRTIAEYLRRGLLTAPEFRGTSTRYQRDHLLRLLAIRRLKSEGLRGSTNIKRRLEAMGQGELERWVLSWDLAPEVFAALGVIPNQTSKGAPAASDLAARAGGLLDGAVGDKAPLETWRCVQLMPGLELSLRADAAPVVRSVASHLYTHLERLILEALSGSAPAVRSAVTGDAADEAASPLT
jgi:DNA-binding transcriptional MerR regulator